MKWLCLLLLLPSLAFGFPTNAVIDTFTGNAQPLGGIWSDDVFAFGLGCEKNGGLVTKDAGTGNDSGCWITAPFSGPLLEVYIDIQDMATWATTQTTSHVLFCLSNPGSATNTLGYSVAFQSRTGAISDEVEVYRINANKSFVQLGTSIGIGEGADGDKFGVEMTAPGVFDVWFKDGAAAWANIGTRTDPGTPYDCTNTYIGLNPRSTASKFDNLGGGTIGTVPGTGSNPFLHLLLR